MATPVNNYRKPKERVVEIRLRRNPVAPYHVHFDLCARDGQGGAILSVAEDVPPRLLHNAIDFLMRGPDGKLVATGSVLGILGENI